MSLSSLLSGLPPYSIAKRKIFVSYHHDNDQAYYNQLSAHFHDLYEIIHDNSLDRKIGSDDCEYVIRSIRERFITGTSCTLVLCGAETPYRKFVDWEIKATLDKQHGLVAVLLPTARVVNQKVIIPDRLHHNVASGFAQVIHWQNLYHSEQGMHHIVNTAVNHGNFNKNLIQNGMPMMACNKSAAYS